MAKGGRKEVEREMTTVEAHGLRSNDYDVSKSWIPVSLGEI